MNKIFILVLVLLSFKALSQNSSINKEGQKASTTLLFGKLVTIPAGAPPLPQIGPIKPGVILSGTGFGELTLAGLTNKNIRIRPGTYTSISIINPFNSKIDASGVTVAGGPIDISNADNLEMYGVTVRDIAYRAINIRGLSSGIYFHDMSFRNIGNSTISYEYDGVYDGTDKTASMNWKLERLTFENTGTGFTSRGGFEDQGIKNLMKNFKFLNNTIKNCPNIGNIVYIPSADHYEIAGNTVDNINTNYPENAPNGIHNGIFMIIGNGSFHDNKLRNHQGNAIRAWGMSYGTVPQSILIYNNTVYNSWKYSAFELQVTPDMQAYLKKYPTRVTYTNAKVFNNTAGHLSVSKDWEGQMLDLYSTGGGLQYYNNLGFEMIRNQGAITDMINWNGNTKITKSYGNKYFKTQKEAVYNTQALKSRYKGIGALK